MSKKIYAPVNGIAQKITKVYAPINGVAHRVKKVYKGVDGIARQVFYSIPPIDATFANNTWESVIAACQLKLVPSTWAVGDQLTMTIGGTSYLVDIIGKNHDNYADGSGKAPLTFQLHDCYNTLYRMNDTATNVGGWASSLMRTTHLPAIMALMPAEVQAGIREVHKLTSIGSANSTIGTTADKLFLLSEAEVRNNLWETFSGEGVRYDYYKEINSVKHFNGTANFWWTRSPRNAYTSQFCYMTTGNNSSSNASASSSLGVAFAFCF